MPERVLPEQLLAKRASALFDRVATDPNRPYWQIEYLAIVTELADAVALLSSSATASAVVVEKIHTRLTSLETRYSELLYHVGQIGK